MDVSEGKLLWSATAYGQYVGATAASGPDVFVVHDGRVIARDGTDGRQV